MRVAAAETDRAAGGAFHSYYLYGLRLRSQWSLPYSTVPSDWFVEVTLLEGSSDRLAKVRGEASVVPSESSWFSYALLRDGATYVRWGDLFEFLVSPDGREIEGRALGDIPPESFYTYLLGQALSFALIRQGVDSLHATVVTIEGEAIAFLGDSGYGKSSLAAGFLQAQAGHRLLTDDLLVVTDRGDGFAAHPGPPRLKLFPEIAACLLHGHADGVPMNPLSPKLVLPLGDAQIAPTPARLKAFYVLSPPRQERASDRVTIRRLGERQACVALLRNTFNTTVTDSGRLHRQFLLAAGLAHRVPVKRLSYPRTLSQLPRVRDGILADLAR